MCRVLGFVIGAIVLQQFVVSTKAINTWTYYFEELITESGNEDLVKFDVNFERVGPGIFLITGSIDVKYEFSDVDFVEVRLYRSASGNSDYQLLPYSVENQTFVSFMNSFYKDAVMTDLSKCSNFPYFEDEFELPNEMKVYEMEKCKISTDSMPQHMPDGFYKMEMLGTGALEWEFTVIVKVEPDNGY